MKKRDWLTVLPLVLIYGISFLLVKSSGFVGIYFWAGGLAVWIVVSNVLRTPNTLPEEATAYPERENAQAQREPDEHEQVIVLSG